MVARYGATVSTRDAAVSRCMRESVWMGSRSGGRACGSSAKKERFIKVEIRQRATHAVMFPRHNTGRGRGHRGERFSAVGWGSGEETNAFSRQTEDGR